MFTVFMVWHNFLLAYITNDYIIHACEYVNLYYPFKFVFIRFRLSRTRGHVTRQVNCSARFKCTIMHQTLEIWGRIICIANVCVTITNSHVITTKSYSKQGIITWYKLKELHSQKESHQHKEMKFIFCVIDDNYSMLTRMCVINYT